MRPSTIEATLELGGHTWSCAGAYIADRDGEVDTAEDTSLDGSYRGTDPFGLFWSAEVPDLYDWDVLHPMRVTLRATSDEQTVETSYARLVVADDVTEHVVAEEGVAGRLFLPERAGRGVVLVGGLGRWAGRPGDGRAARRARPPRAVDGLLGAPRHARRAA